MGHGCRLQTHPETPGTNVSSWNIFNILFSENEHILKALSVMKRNFGVEKGDVMKSLNSINWPDGMIRAQSLDARLIAMDSTNIT